MPVRPTRSASIAPRPTRPTRATATRREQKAYDAGKNDLFPLNIGNGTAGGAGTFGTKGQVMGYFDGNTVTAIWNYAQNYAMSDNMFGDQFGPSTPGAINMFAGQTNGFTADRGYRQLEPGRGRLRAASR